MGTRVAVVGVGANGAAIGADLIRAGHDVTLIEQWPAHVEQMRAHGIRVTDASTGQAQVTEANVKHLCEVAEMRNKFDVIYMVLKAYDTRWGAELVTPLISQDGVVVGLQNGMSYRDLEAIVGADRALGGVIETGSNLLAPGDIERHVPIEKSWFAVGGLHPQAAAKAELVADILRASGTVEVIPEIEAAKWMKLILNASQLVPSGILDISIVEAASRPEMRPIMMEAGLEAIRAAEVSGFGIIPIMGLDPVDPSRPEQFMDDIFELLLNGFALPNTKATMLYDWNHGRRSEVDQINGLVVNVLGAADAPVNHAYTRIAHRIELGELKPSLDNEALLYDLLAR